MVACNECAYCSPTPGGSLYCALTDHFVPNLGCEHGEPINKAKSNADRIRAMSDEDLAEWVNGIMFNVANRYGEIRKRLISNEFLEWLKEEVKDG